MVKLTKTELARRTIQDREYDCDGARIGDLYEKYGPNAYISVEYDYSDVSVTVIADRQETDDEYAARLDSLRSFKRVEAERTKLKKRNEEKKERELYEELKAKFG